MDDDEPPGTQRTLSLRLDVYVDRQPISGRIWSEAGADEPFVGWLEFCDALTKLTEPREGNRQ